MYLSSPHSPVLESEIEKDVRTGKQLPKSGSDEKKIYIATIKSGFPKEEHHIYGVTFAKCILPNEASYADQEERVFDYGYNQVALTEKQAEAILEAAKNQKVKIPRRFNRDAKTIEDEWIDEFECMAIDFIELTPRDEFNPVQKIHVSAPITKDETEKYQEQMIKAQIDKASKKK